MIVGSVSVNSGKTLLISYLIEEARRQGLKPAYLKALGIPGDKSEDGDVLSLREIFRDLDCRSAWLLQPHEEERFISEKEEQAEPVEMLKNIHAELKARADVVFVEAPQGICRGASMGLDLVSLASNLQEKVLMVERGDEPFLEDRGAWTAGILKTQLHGIIINRIPLERLTHIEKVSVPFLKRRGAEVLGLVTIERALMGITIKEILQELGGEPIVGEDKLDEVITGIHVGALPHDRALSRYRKNPDWAVVVSGSRTESIAAAIEARVKVIIVTGGIHPSGSVVARAESEGIPLILVSEETMKVSEIIDRILSKSSVLRTGGVQKVCSVFEKRINAPVILEAALAKKP